MGADGGSSPTRKALGYRFAGESGAVRDFMGGRMFAIHFRSKTLYDVIPHPRAWMYWTVNGDRRAFMATVNGTDQFNFHTQLRDGESENISDAEAQGMFEKALAARHDIEIIARSAWNAGYTLVAEKFQRGRIFLGGDAVHLFTPAGGLGYNTAIEDAVNLGWKLNAVLQGWGGPALLDSYETERQAIATPQHRLCAGLCRTRWDCSCRRPSWRTTRPAGEAARKLTGDHFNHHARFEFNIPGITFGGRYDGSPIIVPDGTAPPPDKVNTYEATACPGGRAPHLWLADGRSLYDALGFEFTLLALGGKPVDTAPFRAAAEALAMPLSVVPIESAEARDLYGADLALIRPDQIVAWRGNSATDATAVLRRVTGHLGVEGLYARAEAYLRITAMWRSRIRAIAVLASPSVDVAQVRYSSSPVSRACLRRNDSQRRSPRGFSASRSASATFREQPKATGSRVEARHTS